jgi:anti-sigma factor RsiW
MSTDPAALSCREFVEVILAYLDGELDARRREVFEAHLHACPACVDYLASYRETVALAGTVGQDGESERGVPEDVPEELVRAVLAARRRG